MSDTPDATAIEAEAADSPTVSVSWRLPERLVDDGDADTLTLTLPRNRLDWPVGAELALRDDDPIEFVREILEPASWAQVRALRPTLRETVDLSSVLVEALGFKSTGESAASSD